MNLLYLIGNGFDLAQGLKTSYQCFYDYLLTQEPVNSLEARMLESIKNEKKELWSDMEIGLGKLTAEVKEDEKQAFHDLIVDLHKKLKQFLSTEEDKFNVTDEITDRFAEDLVAPYLFLNTREQNSYRNYFGSYTSQSRQINIISFNYTFVLEKSIEKLLNINLPTYGYDYKLLSVFKIHGALNSAMLIGVDNADQIMNNSFKQDEDILDILVKPRGNYNLGSTIDDICMNKILSADLLVFKGLSFGGTDQTWWDTVGKRLSGSSARVIIFIHNNINEIFPHDLAGQKRKAKQEFMNKCNIATNLQDTIKDRIFITFSDDFLCSDKKIFYPDNYVRKGI